MNEIDQTRGGRIGPRGLGAALIVLAAAIAATPVWLHRSACGDDLQFHLLSWFDAGQSWRHGVAYPHWTPSANYGAGEPRFVFYPPLTWMLGAGLGLVLPWTWVPVALLFLLFCGTGFGVRAFARGLLPPLPATLAGVAAVLSVYPLYSAYDRAAFGELAGGLWIPLLLLFAMEKRSPDGGALDRSTVWLALAVAGCWLSDAPAGVMGIYLLAAVALALAVLRRSWIPAVRAAIAGTLGVGLAALYILPAAWERRWVNVWKASGLGEPALAIEHNWLFGHSADPALQAHEAGLRYVSWLAVAALAVTAAGVLVRWLRGRSAGVRWQPVWIVLASIPAAVLLLQLPVSAPLWRLLPELRFLQFPWRWLLVLETPMAVFFATAVWPAQSARRGRIVALLLFSGVLLGSLIYTERTALGRACTFDELPAHLLGQLRSGAGSWGADEYEPIGTDTSLVPSGLPDVCVTDTADAELFPPGSVDPNPPWSSNACLSTATATVRSPDHLRAVAQSPNAGYAVLRLQRYPAWRVRVNGQLVRDLGQREDGLIAVPVPAGAADISVDWVTPWDVVAGRIASILAALVLAFLGWRKPPARNPRSL